LPGCTIRVCTVGDTENRQAAFQTCVKNYDANRAFCDERHPENSTVRLECLAAAKIAFEECAKVCDR